MEISKFLETTEAPVIANTFRSLLKNSIFGASSFFVLVGTFLLLLGAASLCYFLQLSILIFSSIQAAFYAKKHNVLESLWAYPYSILYTFSLFWITPYAIATAGRSGWLTWDLTKKEIEEQRSAISIS